MRSSPVSLLHSLKHFTSVFILFLMSFSQTALADIVYSEDFETGAVDWTIDNGVWEVGVPTAGPSACYSGSQCAATVLAGNYPAYDDS